MEALDSPSSQSPGRVDMLGTPFFVAEMVF